MDATHCDPNPGTSTFPSPLFPRPSPQIQLLPDARGVRVVLDAPGDKPRALKVDMLLYSGG